MFFKLKASLYALGVMFLLASNMAHAELVAIPELKSRVTDLTQTLSSDQQAQLDTKLAAFEQQKGSQIAILILPTTQPEDIAQYSIRVVEKWKIGREKVDDGILVLVAKEDRKVRIEVGYGLEGAIPDLTAKRVINEFISPQFKQGNFYGGLDAGIDKLMGLISGEALPETKANSTGGNAIESLLPILLFGGLISGLVLRGILGNFAGSAVNGGLIGAAVWLLGLALGAAVIFAIVAFFFTMMMGGRVMGVYGGGVPMGGGWGGGGSSSWSGGGGGFGGGGASGDW
ncbi:COG1512 Beta-propeller domains of methanol dehydrogenase type [Methylophilaceae bacterium]